MEDKILPYIVNEELSPKNAGEKGYIFVQDVIDPYLAVLEVIELAQKEGYVFGTAEGGNGRIGLYKRIK